MKLSQLLASLPNFTVSPTPEAVRQVRSTGIGPKSGQTSADLSNIPDIDVVGLTADSRQVKPGVLFVAYSGVNLDGHRFRSESGEGRG